MIIYSIKIASFIKKINSKIKKILAEEIGLKVQGQRFYEIRNQFSYPISIVIFNHKQSLGYFNSEFYELGFNERLMGVSEENLISIIRHELAHYLTFIEKGPFVQPHGKEFQEFCKRHGWGEDVYRATICLDEELPNQAEESSALRKIQKLMALATSQNQHEAEQAMIKSQQLLLKYNIETKVDGQEHQDEKFYLKRVLKQRKVNAKMQAIGKILETFFVNIVFSRSKQGVYLEILGNQANVEIAEYVANVLNHELDRLWELAKKQYGGLKGTVAKNSFLWGIAKGYCKKLEFLKRTYDSHVQNAVMIIEGKLVDATALAYKSLRKNRSSSQYCANSSAIGEKVGRELSINPALNQKAKNFGLLIT